MRAHISVTGLRARARTRIYTRTQTYTGVLAHPTWLRHSEFYRLRISKSSPEKKQGQQGVIDQGQTLEHGTDKHDAPSQANIERLVKESSLFGPATIPQIATAHQIRRLVPGSHLRVEQLAWVKEQKEVPSVTSRVSHEPECRSRSILHFLKFPTPILSWIFSENPNFSQELGENQIRIPSSISLSTSWIDKENSCMAAERSLHGNKSM